MTEPLLTAGRGSLRVSPTAREAGRLTLQPGSRVERPHHTSGQAATWCIHWGLDMETETPLFAQQLS